jgi:hypothetical protein
MHRTLVSIGAGAIAALVAGCMLVTGGTSGYSTSGGSGGGGPSCMSASGCGDGGMVCCLIVNGQSTSLEGTCASSCSVSYRQLCSSSTECGDAGACHTLSCTPEGGGGLSVSIMACGSVPGCVGP